MKFQTTIALICIAFFVFTKAESSKTEEASRIMYEEQELERDCKSYGVECDDHSECCSGLRCLCHHIGPFTHKCVCKTKDR
uniref:U32-Deinotoxin-Dsu1a_1 n=1 Tax=Deinopis subrufa TaxID=1905329 RepID=A0A4Q8KC14_DEISU